MLLPFLETLLLTENMAADAKISFCQVMRTGQRTFFPTRNTPNSRTRSIRKQASDLALFSLLMSSDEQKLSSLPLRAMLLV